MCSVSGTGGDILETVSRFLNDALFWECVSLIAMFVNGMNNGQVRVERNVLESRLKKSLEII